MWMHILRMRLARAFVGCVDGGLGCVFIGQ